MTEPSYPRFGYRDIIARHNSFLFVQKSRSPSLSQTVSTEIPSLEQFTPKLKPRMYLGMFRPPVMFFNIKRFIKYCFPQADDVQMSPGCRGCRGHRARLTGRDAKEIYLLRCLAQNHQISSKHIAKKYGVSPKAIRDIWNGRTWKHITKSNLVSCECCGFVVDCTLTSHVSQMRSIARNKVNFPNLSSSKIAETRDKMVDSLDSGCCRTEVKQSRTDLFVGGLNKSMICSSLARPDFDSIPEAANAAAFFFDPFHQDWAYWK